MSSDEDNEGQGSYIVEYVTMGKSVKVSAIDPATGREVSIVGTVKASRKHLSSLAIRKLQYVLDRDKSE